MLLYNVYRNWLIHTYFLLGFSIKNVGLYGNELTLKTTKTYVPAIANFLKNHSLAQFKTLIELTAYDEPSKKNRFTVLYSLLSIQFNTRLQICLKTDEILPILSLTHLYKSAFWAEREVWDLYGIFFTGHNDLRRILTDYNFNGHPLRKDFPLSGYSDLFYDDKKKRLVYAPAEIVQEYRVFNLSSPWK